MMIMVRKEQNGDVTEEVVTMTYNGQYGVGGRLQLSEVDWSSSHCCTLLP